MQTRFVLSDGSVLYSNFLSEAERTVLRDRLEREQLSMFCGCRSDAQLPYGVSKDLKVYPLHNGYEHASWCSRAEKSERNSACVYEENGKSTMYLGFDAKTFSVPPQKKEDAEKPGDGEYINEENDYTTELPTGKKRKKDELPKFSLMQMVATINRDTYSSRIANGKKNVVLSEEFFTTALLAHCKSVYVSGSDKSLRSLSLEEDRYCFIYGKVDRVEESAVYIKGSNGNSYRRFVPAQRMCSALDAFDGMYGCSVQDCMDSGTSVYVSGFAYKRVSREGKPYVCFGRLCFFVVTRNGIFAASLTEKEILEKVMHEACRYGGLFLFPDTDSAPYLGVLRITSQAKEGKICVGNKRIETDGEPVLYLKEAPTDEQFRKFAEDICF